MTKRNPGRIGLNIWRQILFPRDLQDAALYNFCTIECGTINFQRGMQLPERLSNYQRTFTNYRSFQPDCFDRSVNTQCVLCNKTWLKFRKTFCFF